MNLDKLEVKDESGQYLYICCPFHDDSIASLCINKVEHNGRPKGYWYCFGCRASGEITPEQVDKMAKKKGYARKPRLINWHKKAAMFTGGCLAKDYPGDFIYDGSRYDYMIGWLGCWDECYTAPMYNAIQEVIGIHTRALDGYKRSMEGSKLGLFLPVWGKDVGETIIICEGLSDTLVAYHCSGLYSIGLPSATFGHNIVRDFLKNINFEGKIIAVCDADEAGFESVNKLTDILDGKYPLSVVLPTPHLDLWENYKNCGQENTKILLLGDENETI